MNRIVIPQNVWIQAFNANGFVMPDSRLFFSEAYMFGQGVTDIPLFEYQIAKVIGEDIKNHIEDDNPVFNIQFMELSNYPDEIPMYALQFYMSKTRNLCFFGYRNNDALDEKGKPIFDSIEKFSEDYIAKIIKMFLWLLDYVQKKIKKEKHIIKRGLPNVTEIEEIEKNNKPYESQPIQIRDITIQYVYDPHESARQYEKHCESWGVRGHYRHYKSGKVVFIQPYTKGKGRIKETVYQV